MENRGVGRRPLGQGHGEPCSWRQAWPQGPGIAVATRSGAAIVVGATVRPGRGASLLLGCAQLLHAPDLVQQARDEGLGGFVTVNQQLLDPGRSGLVTLHVQELVHVDLQLWDLLLLGGRGGRA